MFCLYIPKKTYFGLESQSLTQHWLLRTLLAMVVTETPTLGASKTLVTQAFQIQKTVWRKYKHDSSLHKWLSMLAEFF